MIYMTPFNVDLKDILPAGHHKPVWEYVDDEPAYVLKCHYCCTEDWPCEEVQIIISELRSLEGSPVAWNRAMQLEG